jgi:hypothetical protein
VFLETQAATAMHAGSDLCTLREGAVAVSSVLPAVPTADSLGVSARFYGEFYASLHALEDALCELTDAMLCAQGPARTLVELSLATEHRPR